MFDEKALLTLVCIIFLDHADDKICILLNNSLIFFPENVHDFYNFSGLLQIISIGEKLKKVFVDGTNEGALE